MHRVQASQILATFQRCEFTPAREVSKFAQTMTREITSIGDTVSRLRAAFASGRSRELAWRLEQLEGLRRIVETEAAAFVEAAAADLRRPDFETMNVEVAPMLSELAGLCGAAFCRLCGHVSLHHARR